MLELGLRLCPIRIGDVLGPKILLPIGCVNMRKNNYVLQPAAGRRTQLFHLIFTQPMVSNVFLGPVQRMPMECAGKGRAQLRVLLFSAVKLYPPDQTINCINVMKFKG